MKTVLVATLKHQATRIIAERHQFKEPVLITEHSHPSANLIDVDDYQLMQSRIAILKEIARCEKTVFENRTFIHAVAVEKMSNGSNNMALPYLPW
ncbi:type II toxin-antitoxin system prevent-host-death family antitoxin [Methylotuvimicrobium sp. KM2]|uniref:type II toxin-antitoxin system Phd/YefM family antitoxin n=1 Tax=Methylotuvimicrobium sp. KM2 TaxID=3133976 RepID=UPI0031017BBC